MTARKSKKDISPPGITESSGNVFADLGLPNPEQEMMKAGLTLQIYRIIRELAAAYASASRQGPRSETAARLTADAQPRGKLFCRVSDGIPDCLGHPTPLSFSANP